MEKVSFRVGILFIYCGLLFLLQACFLEHEEQPTVIKGNVSNQITGEKIAGLPVGVWECESGLNPGSRCDSFTTVFTNADGDYQISFTNQKKHYYKVGIGYNDQYESSSAGHNGFSVKVRASNEFNITTIPFKIIKLNLKASQNSKDRFTLTFQTWDQEANWWGGTIWDDETKRFYQVDTIFYLKVLPLRNYQFSSSLCDKIAEYNYQNCELLNPPDLYVDYVDTTNYQIEIK